eukprot:340242_1
MLSALVVVKTKRQYLAVASGGDFTGAVCLVVNVASSGEWACLRGLWWRLCLHGVDDDVAVKDSLYTAGRRGVANTVLIEKLVGAAAERGDSLDACAELGRPDA